MTSNVEAAVEFLAMVASGAVREAYARHVSVDFTHHNAGFPGDRQSLLDAMEHSAGSDPGKSFERKQVMACGDRVVVLSHLRHGGTDEEFAVVHILRFVDGRVAEMWDVAQAIPPDSPNQLGVF